MPTAGPNSALKPNPLVARMEKDRPGAVFTTRGYIGAVDDENVRIYFDLAFEDFADIPRKAILHAAELPGSRLQRTELVVSADTQMSVGTVRTRTVGGQDIRNMMDEARASTLKTAAGEACGSPAPCTSPGTPGPCGEPDALAKQVAQAQAMARAAEREDEEGGPDPARRALAWMTMGLSRLF